jgi:hypothetical protein
MCKKDRIPVNKASGRSENLGGQIVKKCLLKVRVKILLLPKYMGTIAPLPTSVSTALHIFMASPSAPLAPTALPIFMVGRETNGCFLHAKEAGALCHDPF